MKTLLYDSQVSLVDRLVKEETFGSTREEVLLNVLANHVRQLASGGTPYDNSGAHVIELPKPVLGGERYNQVLEPITGVAVPVHRGEVLRISQVEGGQCVDFNAFNLHDYKEHLDCGFTRTRQPSNVRPGNIIWTGAPRGRPMFVVVSIQETCDVFLRGHRCNAIFNEREWSILNHPNCQDTIAEAIREYGLTPDDVHDSYNLWMSTAFDECGRLYFPWNKAEPGDNVELLATFDTLSVPVVCGSSDLTGISNYAFSSIRVQVFAPSPSTMHVVHRVTELWGSYRSQRSSADFAVKEIRRDRQLEPDPNYEPSFLPAPETVAVDVAVSPQEARLLEALVRRGGYGATESEALKIAFVRWYQANRKTDSYTAVKFTDSSSG